MHHNTSLILSIFFSKEIIKFDSLICCIFSYINTSQNLKMGADRINRIIFIEPAAFTSYDYSKNTPDYFKSMSSSGGACSRIIPITDNPTI